MRLFRKGLTAVLVTAGLATGGALVAATPANADAGGAPYVVRQQCKAWLGGERCDWWYSNGDHTTIYR